MPENSNADAADTGISRLALQTALAKMESFKDCEGIIRQQTLLLNRSLDLHRQAMEFFDERYIEAIQTLDPETVTRLQTHSQDIITFMEQAQQGSLHAVQELQAIVTKLTIDIKDAAPSSTTP